MLIDSYHCSRYNQNTGRLTPAMFEAVFARALFSWSLSSVHSLSPRPRERGACAGLGL